MSQQPYCNLGENPGCELTQACPPACFWCLLPTASLQLESPLTEAPSSRGRGDRWQAPLWPLCAPWAAQAPPEPQGIVSLLLSSEFQARSSAVMGFREFFHQDWNRGQENVGMQKAFFSPLQMCFPVVLALEKGAFIQSHRGKFSISLQWEKHRDYHLLHFLICHVFPIHFIKFREHFNVYFHTYI